MVSIEESRIDDIDTDMNANPDCHNQTDLLTEQQPHVETQLDGGMSIQSDPDEENRDPNALPKDNHLQYSGNTYEFCTSDEATLSNAQNIPIERPIDYDKIQRINQNLPPPNQDEPVGSTTNPIRIIQQGNQFVTTQNLSDDDLKQIIQLLTNKSLINSSGRPNAIYNTVTNKRIVFRVTHARRRKNQPEDPEDPDFNPDMPLEHAQPFPLVRNKKRYKRVSRPPKHLMKDYKRFKAEPNTEYKDEDSDIGYSDYDRGSDESWSPRNSDDESKRNQYVRAAATARSPPRKVKAPTPPPPVGPRQRKERKLSESDDDFECDYCERTFATRAGCVRHMRAKHDAVPATPAQTKTPREDGAPRVDAYMEAVRRRDRLKQAIDEASDDDLLNFVLPRLAKLVTPWEHILIHSEVGDPPLPHIPSLIVQLMNLFETAAPFLSEHLVKQDDEPPVTQPTRDNESTVVDSVVALVDDDGEPPFANINTSNDDATKDLDDVICQALAPSDLSTDDKSQTTNKDDLIGEGESVVAVAPPPAAPQPEETESTTTTVNQELPPTEMAAEPSECPLSMSVDNNKTAEPGDDDKVIVKIMTDEQSRALGLALGRYTCSTNDLKETYLPRRYRSVLAEMKARQLLSPPPSVPPENPPPPQEEEDDIIVPSPAQHEDTTNNRTTDNSKQKSPTPITDDDIASGRYMFVLNDQNEPCDLVMEAETGKLFHRSTGAQVNLVDDEGRLVTGAVLPDEEAVTGDKDIDPMSMLNDSLDMTNETESSNNQEHQTVKNPQVQEGNAESVDEDGDDYVDIEMLFPGISVSQVSETGYIVEKPDGTRFHVDCGEDGLTYETLQAVLTMEEDDNEEES